eukprot:jgi/Tetstr1/458339/TSEL_004304.t1
MGDESAPSDEAASTLSSGHQAQDPEEISCEQGLLVESMERKIARLATTMDGEVEVAEIPRLDGSLAKIPVSPSFFPRPSPAVFKVSSSPRCPFASF